MRAASAWLAVLLCAALPAQSGRIVIGAKNFTESGVLAELMAQMVEAHTGLTVERRLNLVGTMVCWAALRAGEIDVYAEYTGTAWAALLKEPERVTDPLRTFFHVRRRCREEHDLHWLEPFGFDNTYALAMAEDVAVRLGIRRISDLVAHQEGLRAGFSPEFGSREDGYRGLREAYGLRLGSVRALEHSLAYEAIRSGAIDLMDAYSTDGKLLRYRLRVLEDDRRFFPPYHAAPLVRGAVLRAHPEVEAVLGRLASRISERMAQALNQVVESEGMGFGPVARAFLEREGLVAGERAEATGARAVLECVLLGSPPPERAARRTSLGVLVGRIPWLLLEHVALTVVAVFLAALVAIPLGILITRRARLRQLALGAAGVMQTIPSLALLALLIPVLGLDVKSAIAALCLYAILPILRSTYTGIAGVDRDLVDAARGMGMRPVQVLRHVQLPLALRTIMAGIRTATVISIGVATLAAFIGAGGLGEPIVEGLYLDDAVLIPTGAVPAAILAILADLGLGRLERALQRRGA